MPVSFIVCVLGSRIGIFLVLISLAGSVPVCAQKAISLDRMRIIVIKTKTQNHTAIFFIDTLTPAPGSVRVWDKCNKAWLTANGFTINYATHSITINDPTCDTLTLHYRVLPYNLSKRFYLKEYNHYNKMDSLLKVPYYYYPSGSPNNTNLFDLGGISSGGSYSRGLTFGSNQDLVVNSAFNMQLNGRLNDIDITAAISDNSIPIQPDGNTQSLQEFDKVFIQIKKDKKRLILGDFESDKPSNDYYLNFSRKLEGGAAGSQYSVGVVKMQTQIGFAVARGSFAKQTLTAIEGNQGPYKLTGNNGELFIVVLSGSERVYVDGALLKRGADKDYVIDYNQGQVTFTPNKLITKDSRISVEFQYSDQNFQRTTQYLFQKIEWGKWKANIDYYNEGDNKNQPLNQTLSKEDKLNLASVGDSVQKAYRVAADSQAFDGSRVMYKKVQVTGYGSVYVYSTNADSARYVVSFSFTGNNKGHYILVPSTANGKVYQFITDSAGTHRGGYEPIAPLVAPKRKQMVSGNLTWNGGKSGIVSMDAAVSDNNNNTYALNNDHVGLASRLGYSNVIGHDSTHLWTIAGKYEYTQKLFQAPERYRAVEFDRDWNLGTIANTDEHFITSALTFSHKQTLSLSILISYLKRADLYNGLNTTLRERYTTRRQSIVSNLSVLETQSTTFKGVFIRPDLTYTVNWGKKARWRSGIIYRQEYNALHSVTGGDTLTSTSFHNYEGHVFTTNSDTTRYTLGTDISRRYDLVPLHNKFNPLTTASTATLRLNKRFSPRFILNTRATYRVLSISNPALTTLKPDNTALLHVDGNLNKWKNALTFTFLYEILTGQEQKWAYTYVQVPPGQGIYTWIDYNHDGVKQLNEFEIAQYPDQATYVRVANLTNAYVSSHTARATAALFLSPTNAWGNSHNLLEKWLSKFQGQFSVQSDRKTLEQAKDNYLIPIAINKADTELTNANIYLNNGLYFNRFNSHWGLDGVYTQSFNQQLLNNGIESRVQTDRYLKLRITPKSVFITNTFLRHTDKISTAALLTDRNYHINTIQGEEQLSWQPNMVFRSNLSYILSKSLNIEADSQKALSNKWVAEARVNTKTHSALQLTITYARIEYQGPSNSPVSYAMLDALQPGQNWLWSLSWDKKLSEFLNLTIGYDGRSSPHIKTIHTGRAQIRAVF